MDAISKMFYLCHQNKLNKEGSAFSINGNLYEYYYKDKDENENVRFLGFENDNLYLITENMVIPLTNGMLTVDDFENLIESLFGNEEVKFSEESELILRIYSSDHDVEQHLFEYIEKDAISLPLPFQVLYLYLSVNCAGAYEILIKSGLWFLTLGAIRGEIHLVSSCGSPKDILGVPMNVARFFNSRDGYKFFAEKNEQELQHALNNKYKYKLGNRFILNEYESSRILEKNKSIINKKEALYAIAEHLDSEKIEKMIAKKKAILDVLDINIPISNTHLDSAYELILKIPELDALIEQRLELSDYSYQEENGLKLMAPNALQLIEAAFVLKNCLLQYASVYALGMCTILLLYRDDSLIGAIEINDKEMSVMQAYLACNEPIKDSTDEGMFLRRFMLEKGLKEAPIDFD